MTRARILLSCTLALVGCASAPKPGEFSARELMETACPPGFATADQLRTVKGSVWAKIESKDMKGQFPATVLVEYPKRLAVEVTNLIGSPQAWLRMENGRTDLRFSAANEKEYGSGRARDMLGGLPVELAPRLFAGGVPCPSDSKNKDIRVNTTESGGVEVIELDLRSRDQVRYAYSFGRYAGRPWVSEVEWQRTAKVGPSGTKSSLVRILREEPSEPDGAPKRWSASSEQGEIRIRWKDRAVGSP